MNNVVIKNIIGVPDKFFKYKKFSSDRNNKVFYIGKPIILKGIKEFCQILSNQDAYIFGSKPEPLVKKIINYYQVNWNYLGIWHQTAEELKDYFIFLNPSISEGVCTTSIEMLIVGKFLILRKHYSNNIFKNFSNVYFYENIEQAKKIVNKLRYKKPKKVNIRKLKTYFSYKGIGKKILSMLETQN